MDRSTCCALEDPGSVLFTHLAAYNLSNFSCRGSDALFWPLGSPGTLVIHSHTCKEVLIYKIKVN